MSVDAKEPMVSMKGSQVGSKQLTVASAIAWQLPVLLILFASTIFIAVKTIVHRHESRTVYVKLQQLEMQRDTLAAQWSRLKLEQATTLNQVHVEAYARGDLHMQMPKVSEIKIIQEPVATSLVAARKAEGSKFTGSTVRVSGAAQLSKVSLGN